MEWVVGHVDPLIVHIGWNIWSLEVVSLASGIVHENDLRVQCVDVNLCRR